MVSLLAIGFVQVSLCTVRQLLALCPPLKSSSFNLRGTPIPILGWCISFYGDSQPMKKTMSYQVVREEGARSIPVGFKNRLLSHRRANKVCRWLNNRGLDVRVREFGAIYLPKPCRAFF